MIINSLKWAVLLPAAMLVAGAVTSWSLWIGVLCSLTLLAVTAGLVGGVWHRAGAATVASVSIGALMLFAGPTVYDLYLKSLGDPVAAVVVKVVDEDNERGADLFCTVTELGGDHEVHLLSQTENCWDQYRVGDQVDLLKDPLGVLKPRLADVPGQQDDHEIGYAITAGLTLLTGLTIFYGGRRRRTE